MKLLLAAVALAALAACGPQASKQSPPTASPFAERSVDKVAAGAETAAEAPAPTPSQPKIDTPPGAAMLAYVYGDTLELPAKNVVATMKAHERTCVQAGPALCQVLGSSTNAVGEADVRGQLQLRAEPAWLAAFRAKLEGDAKAEGGKLVASTVTSEDLTREIVDTEAHLRAQRTLRDRLQGLLANRPGKLSDLLDVERELARVQGEVDSTESNLAVMKTRVAMSLLTLDYVSAGAPVTDTTFEPIRDSLVKFVRVVAEGFAAMITIIALVLPWALVLWLALWLFTRWRRRRRAGKASAATTQTANPG
jgi:hypothetical protein